MKTSEMAKRLKEYIGELVTLFSNRNLQYASEEEWSSNFDRNAAYNKVYRIKEIIEKPYGVSIEYILQKMDRLVNAIIQARKVAERQGMAGYPQYKSIPDSIDDMIVYLFITKNLLIKEGLISEEK